MIVGGAKKENGDLEIMLNYNDYSNLHTSPLVPLDIKINVDSFRTTMEKYEFAFRRWGQDHLDKQRFALPIVNLSGRLDDNPDKSLIPLDKLNENQQEKLWDSDFKNFTQVINEPCFDVLSPIKPYMIRSSILKWHTGSLFYPHIDTWFPSPILRLWGTDNPESMHLSFTQSHERTIWNEISPGKFSEPEFSVEEASKDLIEIKNVEAGRLYLIDTAITHDAKSSADNLFQFFFALDLNSVNTVKSLMI